MASEFFAPLAQERRRSGILSGDGQADLTRSDAGRESRVPLRWFVVAAVVFGLVCRLSQYAANTSVWHDEAFVALNVLQKSYAGLLGPLDWGEVSPPGFLIVEKLVASWLGRSEYALRLIPLLAGLAGMICFAGLARRVCTTGLSWFWAVLLMAASAKLIVQANEIKHFTLDLLWAVPLGWLAIRIWHHRAPRGLLLAWGALGAVALWLSFASLFVFAGTSLILSFRALRLWGWPARAGYVIANLAVLASLILLLGPIRVQRTGQVLGFWAHSFPDNRSSLALLYWLARSHLGLFNYFWQPFGVLLLGLTVLGSAAWWQKGRRAELLCLILPVSMALVASFLHRWPFGGNQHLVFAAPAILMLVAEGSEVLRRRVARWNQSVAWLCVALMLLPGTVDAAYRIASPRLRHEVRPVVEFVQRHLQPGDQLLVFDPATVEFYTGRDFRKMSVDPVATARVWFIATGSASPRFPARKLLDQFRERRPELSSVEAHGAAAYLFGPEDVTGK